MLRSGWSARASDLRVRGGRVGRRQFWVPRRHQSGGGGGWGREARAAEVAGWGGTAAETAECEGKLRVRYRRAQRGEGSGSLALRTVVSTLDLPELLGACGLKEQFHLLR